MLVIGPCNPKSFKQGCGKHETIRNLKSKSPLDALVSVWEDSICTTHHFLSDAEILKIKTYVPQAVAHHVDAHFLHGLLVLNVQHRLAAERLRFKGKIRILRAGIFGTAEAILNVSCSLLYGCAMIFWKLMIRAAFFRIAYFADIQTHPGKYEKLELTNL